MIEFEKIQRDPHSRREFLARMGAAGLGLAAVSMLQGCGGGSSSNNNTVTSTFPIAVPGNSGNVKVLNYALTLEILEADLYRQALNLATGRDLTAALESSASVYTMDSGVGDLGAFNTAGFNYLRDFAFVEAAHRDFLTATISSLSDTPVARNPKGYAFVTTPAKTLSAILAAILPLEETGVRAYLGASPYFVDFASAQTKTLIQAAVGIYSTEARHSAAIQYILGQKTGATNIGPNGTEPGVPANNRLNGLTYSDAGLGDTFEYSSTPDQVIRAVNAFFVK